MSNDNAHFRAQDPIGVTVDERYRSSPPLKEGPFVIYDVYVHGEARLVPSVGEVTTRSTPDPVIVVDAVPTPSRSVGNDGEVTNYTDRSGYSSMSYALFRRRYRIPEDTKMTT